MKLELRYGDDTRPLDVPDRNLLAVIKPNRPRPTQDIAAELAAATAAAATATAGCSRLLVLVNDYTRPTPNQLLLSALEPALTGRNVRYMVCLGTHRPPTEAELAGIFGPDFLARHREQVIWHDCKDPDRLFFKGRTSLGTDVWFAKELLWPDCIIALNSVEPHYFAGFTGGRKTFLPGAAGYDTICQNHNMVTHEKSLPFSLAGNPVHDDMAEAARMLMRPVFSVQVVLDAQHRVYSLYYGDLEETLRLGAADSRRVYAVPISEQADVVLSVLPDPYDINFYQSQRAVEFARGAFKSRSVQITVSACREGVGNDGFLQVFRQSSKPADVLSSGPTGHPLGWHKAARLARIMETTELFTVMGIGEDVARSAFMTPFPTAQAALDAALARFGPDARVYVLPDAAAVVPVVEK